MSERNINCLFLWEEGLLLLSLHFWNSADCKSKQIGQSEMRNFSTWICSFSRWAVGGGKRSLRHTFTCRQHHCTMRWSSWFIGQKRFRNLGWWMFNHQLSRGCRSLRAICHVYWALWCKYSHPGQFPATMVESPHTGLGDVQDWPSKLVWAVPSSNAEAAQEQERMQCFSFDSSWALTDASGPITVHVGRAAGFGKLFGGCCLYLY